ncbi:hypothetical protein [Arthrobacter castelli]|uniref:hypothetical protein n=1 Tax=Arthrobacter castelli TaxID=271431 RepID=UPI0003FC73C2|nr:hypothetical protein [Arthrobacter castelli]
MTDTIGKLKLTKTELIDLADRMRERARKEHDDVAKWRNRALAAEARLKLYDHREAQK